MSEEIFTQSIYDLLSCATL